MAESPRLSGAALRNLARFARTRLGAIALRKILRKDLGLEALVGLPDAARGTLPLDTLARSGRAPREMPTKDLPWPTSGWAPSSATLTQAYREGRVSPRDVVKRALAEARRLQAMTPGVGPLIEYADVAALEEAAASERRWKEGRPLGPLDGVPWAVKEQHAVRGLARRAGTSFLDPSPQPRDATAVARLREAGAITLGTTGMTEHGMTPNGASAKRALPRNPHATDRLAGGSSTGSGVAVATGLVPFALGADGGGSIRIPAAINGVFGIKPTWGRVSRAGDATGSSVSHLGPLACGTVDLARALEAMSGHDPEERQTLAAPERQPGSFLAALGRGVAGLVVGVPDAEWAHAEGPVARAGRAALAALEREGARLVPLRLPIAEHASALGVVIIACEARGVLAEQWRDHKDEMTDDLQVTFGSLDTFSAVEYLDACRLREGLRAEMAKAFETVDLVALPTTMATAARVSETDMRTGFLDTRVINGLCRFCFMGNLTGLPAASIPVGCDGHGLPIGLQLVGDAWDEATVLAASAHLERIGGAVARRPRITARILE